VPDDTPTTQGDPKDPMSDQPGPAPEERLPAVRPDVAPVKRDRLSGAPTAHRMGLSGERAAQIVRQSGSARWVAFIGVSIVALFVIGYYFYDLGFPGVAGSSRLERSRQDQVVTDVSRGYKLFQANCARCHGDQGQGGIGPVLNDEMKLLAHLNPQYLLNVLQVGGRYVCGDANSLMPTWAQPVGPLNYQEVNELIAWLRAPNDLTFTGTDPATGQPAQISGWRDPSFVQPPSATPVPNCWKDAFAPPSAQPGASPGASAAPSPSGGASAAPSGAPAGTVIKLTAQNIAFDLADITVPADQPFQIEFTNNDAGIPHNVAIHEGSPTGNAVFTGEIVTGVTTTTYDVPALKAGAYGFVCTVHPNMTGTLTAR
jgi:plastocyanin/mono/diheme cytochrome c family protein